MCNRKQSGDFRPWAAQLPPRSTHRNIHRERTVARLVSFIVLAAIIVLFAVLFFQVMAQFLLPMFLAVILVVMFRPVHQWFILKCGGRVRTAAGLTTFTILLIVLAPMISIMILAVNDAYEVLRGVNPDIVISKLTKLRERVGLDLGLPSDEIERLPELESRLNELESGAIMAETLQQQRDLLDRLAPDKQAGLVQDFEVLLKSIDAKRFDRDRNDNEVDEHAIARANAARLRVREMQDLLAQLRREATAHGDPAAEPAEADELPANAEFAKTVSQLRSDYYQFKSDVVGSPLLVNVRLWANPTPKNVRDFRDGVLNWIRSYAVETGTALGSFVANFVIGLAVLVISLYYFLADGPRMITSIMRLSPLDDRYERQLLDEFDRISRAVVLATLLSAVVQGILAGIGFAVLGFKAIFLLTVVTMVLAMVPFVGAAAVWGTCAVWLLVYEERIGAAIALVIYGTCVVSTVDNIIKPIVLHGQSKLHPLLALLSVLGGVRALGPIGIFVGPMVVAFLQALLNILNTELSAMSQRIPTLHAPE
jgi:predicted PurR-regulated permease PerM